jgi:acyl-CoA thioester hydrolase
MSPSLGGAALDAASCGSRVRYRVRVGYGDTDQGGIVHHSVYVRWLEQARVEFLRAQGIVYRDLELDQQYALPVVKAELEYKRPATFDQEIEVETWVGELRHVTVRFDYTVWHEGERLCDARITLACIRLPEMKPLRMPDQLRHALAT